MRFRAWDVLDKVMLLAYNVSTLMATAAARPKRNKRLNLRASSAQKRLLEIVADREDVTVSEFVLESACTRAESIIAEERHFALPPDRWKAFVSALDRPARSKTRLRKLLSEPSVLER
jgi:uncharacterized protein (DUF1778 family)